MNHLSNTQINMFNLFISKIKLLVDNVTVNNDHSEFDTCFQRVIKIRSISRPRGRFRKNSLDYTNKTINKQIFDVVFTNIFTYRYCTSFPYIVNYMREVSKLFGALLSCARLIFWTLIYNPTSTQTQYSTLRLNLKESLSVLRLFYVV